MSVQFGKCNFDGKPLDPKDLDQVRPVLAPYGPDGESYICKDNLGIVYRAFHTTKEGRLEKQPHVSQSGAVITWDGRLDNREELSGRLNDVLSTSSTDLSIVVAAYDSWGTDAFARLIGDWAISIWDPSSWSLILAKDFVGTRHLYYLVEKDEVIWCTILDPLVLFAGHSFALEEEYIAGWLSSFPAAHLTPYVGIHSVPPSSFVFLQPGRCTIQKYWDFDPSKRIHYRTDIEYEEHFRCAFSEAVRRRLRSDSAVLAELSGGMDSSSIVCVADAVLACGIGGTPRLDTVSHYDDSEPNWNERPYFGKVETMRGRPGWHIDIGSLNPLSFESDRGRFAATPSSAGCRSEVERQFAECISAQGNRAVLSGIGGDEFTGGVPSPIPELGDLLSTAHFKTLAHQLKRWALNKRVPWFHLLYEAAREFMPEALQGGPTQTQPIPWVQQAFVEWLRLSLNPYQHRLTICGPLPSFQQSLKALDLLRGQLACYALSSDAVCEKRYPFLDRDLTEFLISVPREQLVRPGQRRSLMRRALAGIVPHEILDRKRKAFVVRGPLARIQPEWQSLVEASRSMRSESLKIVDSQSFLNALKRAADGQDIPLIPLLRTVSLERWLRNLEHWNSVQFSMVLLTRPPLPGSVPGDQAKVAISYERQALS